MFQTNCKSQYTNEMYLSQNSYLRVILIILLLILSFSVTAETIKGTDPRITPTVKAVAKALPSVVNIGTERIVSTIESPWGTNDPFERLFRNFYEKQKGRKETSLGSGALISSKGLVVTNSHVVHHATKIIVTAANGKQYIAKEIAGDPLNDIALLQLINVKPEDNLRPIEFGTPDSLILGEPVIAVGNPYGLGSSISRGVLSAIGRKVSFNGQILFSDILQTDAAINPGNSGGPLINIKGQMIGINTAIYGEAAGIGFAIPLKRIESILASWMIPERFSDVSLGLIPGEEIHNGKIKFVIREVLKNSPAWKAGISSGDIIVKVNRQKITSLINISNHLWHLNAGDTIELTLEGKGVKNLQVERIEPLDSKTLALNRLGIGLEKLTIKIASALHYPFHGGLLVNDVTDTTEGVVQRGEVLVRINNIPVYDFSAIRRALANKHYGDNVSAVFLSIATRNRRAYITKRDVTLKVQ